MLILPSPPVHVASRPVFPKPSPIRLAVFAFSLFLLVAPPLGGVEDRVRLSSRLAFDRPPPELKIRSQSSTIRLLGEEDHRIEVFHVWGSSTERNFEVEEKYVDGDAPGVLLSAILTQDARRYYRLLSQSSVKKIRTRLGTTLHYGILDVFATDEQLTWGPWRIRVETRKGRPPRTGPVPRTVSGKRLRIYHLLIKDRAATRWEHVVLRAPAETERKYRKAIQGILRTIAPNG